MSFSRGCLSASKDQNRRAIAVEPDLYRKDKPSPEYEKARQQIRQLDGVADPPPEAKTSAVRQPGDRGPFREQAKQIEQSLSDEQRLQLLREGWTQESTRPPVSSGQASVAIRRVITQRLQEGQSLFLPDPPIDEPSPEVDRGALD